MSLGLLSSYEGCTITVSTWTIYILQRTDRVAVYHINLSSVHALHHNIFGRCSLSLSVYQLQQGGLLSTFLKKVRSAVLLCIFVFCIFSFFLVATATFSTLIACRMFSYYCVALAPTQTRKWPDSERKTKDTNKGKDSRHRSEPQKTYKYSLFIKLVIGGKSSGSLEDPQLSREGRKKDLARGTTRKRLFVQSNPFLFMGLIDSFSIVLLNVTNLSNTNSFLITWPLNKESKRRQSCPSVCLLTTLDTSGGNPV